MNRLKKPERVIYDHQPLSLSDVFPVLTPPSFSQQSWFRSVPIPIISQRSWEEIGMGKIGKEQAGGTDDL